MEYFVLNWRGKGGNCTLEWLYKSFLQTLTISELIRIVAGCYWLLDVHRYEHKF